jgi:sugar lactone lactonase YvrE
MNHRYLVLAGILLLLSACGNSSTTVPVSGPTQTPSSGVLYAYSPDGEASVATFPGTARGTVSPSTLLAGARTTFVGGRANLFGGGISIAPNGTLYVFDAMRARVLTFAAGARGNAAPTRVERLPQNGNVSLKVPQYAGFALDGAGNFWTVDRTNGNIVRFPLGGSGPASASLTFKPSVRQGRKLVAGVASTVASDGEGYIYCVCQPDDLALQLYCITEYAVTGNAPTLVRSFYGIWGNLDTQIPSTVLHVDPHTKMVYVGTWKPAAVFEYRSDAPSGPAPRPNVIGGRATGLDSVPAAITTDSDGNVYVAQRSTILVFAASAGGNVKPIRAIADPKRLHFWGQAYGDLLAIHSTVSTVRPGT